jgi:hypothetical protein
MRSRRVEFGKQVLLVELFWFRNETGQVTLEMPTAFMKQFLRPSQVLQSGLIRVTRLGDYFFGQFIENYRSSANSRATFVHSARYVLILTKSWVGRHFVRLFYKHFWSQWDWSGVLCTRIHQCTVNSLSFFILIGCPAKTETFKERSLSANLTQNLGTNLIDLRRLETRGSTPKFAFGD